METFPANALGDSTWGGERAEKGPGTAAFIRSPSVLVLFTMCTYYFDKKFKGGENEKK